MRYISYLVLCVVGLLILVGVPSSAVCAQAGTPTPPAPACPIVPITTQTVVGFEYSARCGHCLPTPEPSPTGKYSIPTSVIPTTDIECRVSNGNSCRYETAHPSDWGPYDPSGTPVPDWCVWEPDPDFDGLMWWNCGEDGLPSLTVTSEPTVNITPTVTSTPGYYVTDVIPVGQTWSWKSGGNERGVWTGPNLCAPGDVVVANDYQVNDSIKNRKFYFNDVLWGNKPTVESVPVWWAHVFDRNIPVAFKDWGVPIELRTFGAVYDYMKFEVWFWDPNPENPIATHTLLSVKQVCYGVKAYPTATPTPTVTPLPDDSCLVIEIRDTTPAVGWGGLTVEDGLCYVILPGFHFTVPALSGVWDEIEIGWPVVKACLKIVTIPKLTLVGFEIPVEIFVLPVVALLIALIRDL